MTRRFETDIEFVLENFPDGVSIGLNDHAAFDDLGGLSQVALQNRVLIPCREIFLAWSNWRICHVDISSFLSNPGPEADDLYRSNLKQYKKCFLMSRPLSIDNAGRFSRRGLWPGPIEFFS